MTPQPGGKSRLLPYAGLFIGALAIVVGLVMTILSAYLINKQITSAGEVDAATMTTMKSFFHSMNHFAAVSVGITLGGMIIFLFSRTALSRSKKATGRQKR